MLSFTRLPKKAIKAAIEEPRPINYDLVDAQQARRALDYLIGFYASPLLWKKVRRGLSAGRVQSPALCLIVNREKEIRAFEAREYWTINAHLAHPEKPFQAKLAEFKQKKIQQFSITNADDANSTVSTCEQAASGALHVANVETKPRKRNPAAPFTTSTLQQEATRKIGFSSAKTMMVAQQLYEVFHCPKAISA